MENKANRILPQNNYRAWEEFEIVRQKALREEQEKRCAEIVLQQIQKIPSRYRGMDVDDFKVRHAEQAHVKSVVERYLSTFTDRLNEGTNLIFLGNPGTGKTMLSLILYQALVQKGFSVCYEPSLQFLRLCRDKNFESYSAFESLLTHYQRMQLLIIDEVSEGQVRGGVLTDWELMMLFTMINARYQQTLCTLVISNRSKKIFTERLGERLTGRLMQNGIELAFNWNSYR